MATILIVDDLSADRKVFVTLLSARGHRLLEAANGKAGLEVVRAERPDLVITDMIMPVMSGNQFVSELRLDPATRAIPVVVYTANYSEREARALSESGGVSHVLMKPAKSEDLLEIVERVLSGEAKAEMPSDAPPFTTEFDREYLRLLADKLSEKAGNLTLANERLRALINIGLELASERDPDRLLQSVCVAARDLFGATYVTLGIVDLNEHRVQRLVTTGTGAVDWIRPGDSVSGMLRTVVAERRALRGENPGGSPVGLELPELHPEVQAFLAAPVASPTQVFGWFCLVGNEGRPFTADDEDLVMALSGQIGRIYENGYFHTIAEERAKALEHEIIERKRVELALRHERDRAQRYLDTAEVILLALDVHGRITLVNRYACSVLGWTADELLGRDWVETCLPVRVRDTMKAKFADLVRGDLSIVENHVLTRSGEERLFEWRNSVLKDDAGHVTGTISSGTDITERIHAVDALRNAEERMRFTLQSADVGIWDMDYTRGVLRWSEILETQYGLQPGAFGGTFAAFIEHVHPDDRESVLETVGNAMKSGADFTLENRAIWPDGTVRWLRGTGRIHLGEHGEPVRGVGISQDITERRALEAQYLQAQKMEAIGRLAGGVAHDFNNLLTAILGYSELLLADLDPEHPLAGDISRIHKAGQSAAALTRQLLAFSRKQIIEPKLLDLNEVVADVRAILGRLIREDLVLVLNLQPDLAPINADRGQVEQIVVNLAVNAQDAMPHGGRLTIETANVVLDENYAKAHLSVKPGTHVVLTMTDSGIGMTPQVLAQVFEPFFTTKGPGIGTGLGLATVHGIVERIGGSIDVDSTVGKGTTFKVYFPMADATEMIVEAATTEAWPPGGGRTVLVVDDAEWVGDLARRLLERQGYTVLVASNADEAVQISDRNRSIDLLLTDVVMPGGSGPELASRLLERRPALKVIYLSGYTDEAIVQHGVINPGILFLHKPFTSEALGRKISQALDPSVRLSA